MHVRSLHRWLRPSPLEIVYKPPAQTSVWRSMRDYYIEVRNRSTDRTISSVIVTWDETVFTRAIDNKLSRECLLSLTSIEPSSSVSVFLFSLKDDIRTEGNKNNELGRESTFTIRVSGIVGRTNQQHDSDISPTKFRSSGGCGVESQQAQWSISRATMLRTVAGVRCFQRPDQLWAEYYDCLAPARHLRREDTQGRKARGFASHTADQVRPCHQSYDRQGARPRNSTNTSRPRRRGDRMMGWMAPLRHRRAKLVFRRITRNGSHP